MPQSPLQPEFLEALPYLGSQESLKRNGVVRHNINLAVNLFVGVTSYAATTTKIVVPRKFVLNWTTKKTSNLTELLFAQFWK